MFVEYQHISRQEILIGLAAAGIRAQRCKTVPCLLDVSVQSEAINSNRQVGRRIVSSDSVRNIPRQDLKRNINQRWPQEGRLVQTGKIRQRYDPERFVFSAPKMLHTLEAGAIFQALLCE